MSNEEKSEIEAKREAAADTNAGLYIRCLKFWRDVAPRTPATLATFVAGEIQRSRQEDLAKLSQGLGVDTGPTLKELHRRLEAFKASEAAEHEREACAKLVESADDEAASSPPTL